MGKPRGFLEIKRQTPKNRPPEERIKDWNEFHTVGEESLMQEQSARCMSCGIPFCNAGVLISGMASGCPLGNLIPEWNDLVYRGKWKEAYKRLEKTNCFPEFTGRVCPAPCEGACTNGYDGEPVTIHDNECAIIEKAFENGWVEAKKPAIRTGKKIAVVGSGPSGLAAAMQLNRVGHDVTVYERADRPGGLMMYGIPNMKLDKNIIQRRIDLMVEEGVNFQCGVDVGKQLPVTDLKTQYDAVVLCCGSTNARDLKVEGRQLDGVYFAMEFLAANTKSLLDSTHKDGAFINAKDKNIIVIGGGDTGTDCVGTSIRHGCNSVVQFEIMPKPADARQANNPWPEWPKVLKMDYGQEEAKYLYGDDPRQYLISTTKMVGDENGNVTEVHTVQIEWKKDENGRFIPVPVEGTEKVWKADIVLLALGFLGPDNYLVDALEVERDARSNVKATEKNYATSEQGIFAAGDVRRGQSLVVWAISEGRQAAKACDAYLMGTTAL
jgi:glutamate synthase (NADPH/NADH) small chain